jgi:site-specific recombinase XerD
VISVFSLEVIAHDSSSGTQSLVAVKQKSKGLLPAELSSDASVAGFLRQLLSASHDRGDARAAALVPWVCDRMPSVNSRKAYFHDLASFVSHLATVGINPLDATGDDIRIYKEALRQSGKSSASIAHMLSALRGTYEQFGKRKLVEWDRVRDIQAVTSPRVEKNTTPALSEAEARRLLHAPDTSTLLGLRDHALLFVFFKTACRCSAVAGARVGSLERTDTDYYLLVREKGNKQQRKALLEAAPAVRAYLNAAAIGDDLDGPLFRPIAKDRRTILRKPLDRRTIWYIVKKYAREAGINTERLGGRGIAVHALRKTAITNALEHGAKMEQVQQLAGHADIRTTQLYYQPRERDAEEAARHIQIR